MLLYRQESFKVGFHPAKFGGHRHSDSGDIMLLVCHVISLNSWRRSTIKREEEERKQLQTVLYFTQTQ